MKLKRVLSVFVSAALIMCAAIPSAYALDEKSLNPSVTLNDVQPGIKTVFTNDAFNDRTTGEITSIMKPETSTYSNPARYVLASYGTTKVSTIVEDENDTSNKYVSFVADRGIYSLDNKIASDTADELMVSFDMKMAEQGSGNNHWAPYIFGRVATGSGAIYNLIGIQEILKLQILTTNSYLKYYVKGTEVAYVLPTEYASYYDYDGWNHVDVHFYRTSDGEGDYDVSFKVYINNTELSMDGADFSAVTDYFKWWEDNFILGIASSNGTTCFDNFLVYEPYAFEALSVEQNDDGTFSVNYGGAVDASASSVAAAVTNGTESISCTAAVSDDKRSITVTPSQTLDLTAAEYTLTLSGVTGVTGDTAPDVSVVLGAASVSDLTLSGTLEAGGTVTAKAAAQAAGTDAGAWIIIAYYEGNVLKNAVFDTVDVAVGEAQTISLGMTLPDTLGDNPSVKAFVWSDAENIKPLSACTELK